MEQRDYSIPKRILIVDDDEATIFGYTRFLSRSGFAIESAMDLATSLDKLSREHFDAVVFDLRLPDGNALDVIPAVRAKNKNLKIFVVSGLSDPAVVEQALDAGADKFLVKPLSIEELCNQITGAFPPKV